MRRRRQITDERRLAGPAKPHHDIRRQRAGSQRQLSRACKDATHGNAEQHGRHAQGRECVQVNLQGSVLEQIAGSDYQAVGDLIDLIERTRSQSAAFHTTVVERQAHQTDVIAKHRPKHGVRCQTYVVVSDIGRAGPQAEQRSLCNRVRFLE